VQVRHQLERRVTKVRTKAGIAASLRDLADAFRR
jgi:hypothetical protein